MKTILAVSLATLYGISLRMLFGLLDNFLGIMSVSFLILAPVIIGFLTIILLPKERIVKPISAFFTPWLTSLLILIVTMLLNIEGSICWIMIYPLFSILAGIGGYWAYHFRKKVEKEKSEFDNPNTLKVSLVLFIPAVVGMIEGERSLSPKDFIITESIEIAASPKDVWQELTNVDGIKNQESNFSFSNLMGFPKHLQTTLDTLAIGGKRKAIYENGLYFDETISNYEQEKLLVLDIKTDPNNIPPTVMDEHIVIGGKHVDILQDTYTLEKITEQSSRLTLSSRFYINTPFNWYAGIWANYLMADILKGQLKLIKFKTVK